MIRGFEVETKKIADFLEFLKKALKLELDMNDYDDFFLGFRSNKYLRKV